MKVKIIKIILPTILGIFAVLGVLVILNFIIYDGDAFSKPDNGFFTIFVPISTFIAITIQLVLTLPFWEKFKSYKKVWGLTLFQFTTILCIISGLIFGLVFWERSFGFGEFIAVSITGIIAFAIYWTVNLITIKQIEKL
ncbi:MAG TPA: hypothetical protein PLW77_00795 [Bacteroidales bacterium]|nr:hypothetical protein [Bacteroidales bacterium]HQB21291.1 hypothetical protein [Bacteroidales bacterium]